MRSRNTCAWGDHHPTTRPRTKTLRAIPSPCHHLLSKISISGSERDDEGELTAFRLALPPTRLASLLDPQPRGPQQAAWRHHRAITIITNKEINRRKENENQLRYAHLPKNPANHSSFPKRPLSSLQQQEKQAPSNKTSSIRLHHRCSRPPALSESPNRLRNQANKSRRLTVTCNRHTACVPKSTPACEVQKQHPRLLRTIRSLAFFREQRSRLPQKRANLADAGEQGMGSFTQGPGRLRAGRSMQRHDCITDDGGRAYDINRKKRSGLMMMMMMIRQHTHSTPSLLPA